MRLNRSSMALAMAGAILLSAPAIADDAAPQVVSIDVAGNQVHASPAIPPAMLGLYRYERQGEPVIELGPGNVGSFQAHGVAPIPIRYWIQTDETGVPYKQSGEGNPNYLHVLVVQYGPGGGGNYPEGSHDRWQWIHDVEGGCAILLGERYKCGGAGG